MMVIFKEEHVYCKILLQLYQEELRKMLFILKTNEERLKKCILLLWFQNIEEKNIVKFHQLYLLLPNA